MRGLRFILLAVAALAAFSVYVIISSTDPHNIGLQMQLLFYGSLFLSIVSTIALVSVTLHPFTRKTVLEPLPLLPVIRLGMMIGLIIIAMLLLSSLRSLSWLNAVLIIFAAALFELFFRVRIPLRQQKQL